ncbi:hypothetical protein BCR35DRAFT_356218 [Leucosporidium creatinivorum]|uniref:Proteophosphoglycan ppg4 n=1 Tax=Leucosporidium creatinivorum TaxID=106004 RepID=A0A1Y2CJH3_9BASI|nr:hypothetical protein BCR35DRAFT_356218 [Leucosporidium creatinivorum]
MSSPSTLSTSEMITEHYNNLPSQSSPASPRQSAIPISPRTSFSSPRTLLVAAPPTAPLAPRRPGPISIPPTPTTTTQPTFSPPSTTTSPSFDPSPNPSTSTAATTQPMQSPSEILSPDTARKVYNPGWSHPFPSSQLEKSPPRRPPRPARPAEALMFASPLPFPSPFPRTPEQQDAFDNEDVDLVTFVAEQGGGGHDQGHSDSSPEMPQSGEFPRKNSSHRKPVPRYVPSPPLVQPPTPGRLSIGGFEALLARGVGSEAGVQKRSAALNVIAGEKLKGKGKEDDNKVFSPRVGLGLPEEGMEARKQRQERDEARFRSGGRSVAGPSQLGRGGGGDLGEENIVSWSDRLRQSEWMPSAFAKRPSTGSALSPRTANRRDDWRTDGPPTAALVHAYNPARNPSTENFRPVQAINTPAPDRRRNQSTPNLSYRRPSTSFSKHLQEVVVVPSGWDDDSIDEDDVRAREASCRPERMNWEMLEYRNWFPKFVHMFYPLFVLAHYPATLFLDYNVIYTLVQIALSPSLPSTSIRLATRGIVDIPTLRTSTAWWVAVGIYSACTFLWVIVIALWVDLYLAFIKPWVTGGRVPIGRVYRGASSFNLACMSSYSRFCFLWRVRMAPFQKASPLARAVKGTCATDGIAETFGWYSQNWPTVILLVPRAGLSLALLLLFGTTAYGTANETASDRDSAYFHRNGTLTGFAQGVLLTNCAWAALRLLFIVISYLGLFLLSKPFSRSEAYSAYYHPSREHLNVVETEDDIDEKQYHERRHASLPGWKLRRDRRLRAAILVCLRSSAQSSPAFSPYAKSTPRIRPMDDDRDAEDDEKKAERRARREQKRLAKLALGGIDWQQLDQEMTPNTAQHDGRWGVVSPYVLPSPRVHSPLMTFSPASVSEYAETPAMPSSGGLHRRVRSVPVRSQADEDEAEELREVRFDDAAPRAPSTSQRSPRPTTPQRSPVLGTSHRSPPPRPLSLHVDAADTFVPGLKSHFSFISTEAGGARTPGSGANSNLATPLPSPALLRTVSTDVAPSFTPQDEEPHSTPSLMVQPASPARSPGLGPSPRPTIPASPSSSINTQRQSTVTLEDHPSPSDVRYARHEVLQRQIAQGVVERRQLSEKLLVEVQRLGEAEEAVRREERRLATLRRISEVTSAPETRSIASETGHEENRLSTTSALSQELAPSSDPQAPGLLLPPFRLSYGSHDSSASLAGLAFVYAGSSAPSPSASPDLDDGAEFGDLGNSTTAAFLSSSSAGSSSEDEDDDDRSLTPTQAGRRRDYAIHQHQHFSPETFGVGRPRGSELSAAEGEAWAWREAALPTLPTAEGEEEDVVSH